MPSNEKPLGIKAYGHIPHGTRYRFNHWPFLFDVMTGNDRLMVDELQARNAGPGFATPHVLHQGGPCSIAKAMELASMGSMVPLTAPRE